MLGLTSNRNIGGRAEIELSDEPVVQACEAVLQLNQNWVDINPESELPRAKCWNAEEHWQLVLQRDQAVESVRLMAPVGIAGLIAKYEVLLELVLWKGLDDEKVASFSLELNKNFNSIFLKGHFEKFPNARSSRIMGSVQNAAHAKRTRRFNVKTFFSNMGG